MNTLLRVLILLWLTLIACVCLFLLILGLVGLWQTFEIFVLHRVP